MGAGVVAAEVAGPGVEVLHPAPAPRPHRDLGAIGVAAQDRIEGPDHQPVAARRGDVAKDAGRTGERRHDQVQGTVAVDVAARQAATHVRLTAERGVGRRDVPKPAVAAVGKQLVALLVVAPERRAQAAGSRLGSSRLRALDPAIHHRGVNPAVLIEIGQHDSKPGAAPGGSGQAGRCGPVLKEPLRSLSPEGQGLLGEVGHEDVEETVSIDIADANPHVRLGRSHGVAGDPARQGFLLERAIPLVDPEVIGLAVVGDHDVGPAVAAEVAAEDAQAGTGGQCHADLDSDILETDGIRRDRPGAAQVAKKFRDGAEKRRRAAEVPPAIGTGTPARRVVVEIVDDHEVEPAVTVVIEERRGCPPEAAGRA